MQHPRVLIRWVLTTYNIAYLCSSHQNRFYIASFIINLPIITFNSKNTILLLSVIILKIDSSYIKLINIKWILLKICFIVR